MKIRKATQKDVKKCADIQKLDKKTSFKKSDLKYAIKNRDVIFIVGEESGEILGYTIGYIDPCLRKDVLISETRVDKRLRKKGIGTKLVEAFCKECFKKNKKEIAALIRPKHIKFYVKSCKFKKRDAWIEVVKRK